MADRICYTVNMKIKIICVGKLKEKYWTDAVSEYMKRLSSYVDMEVVELKEYKQRGEGAAAEEQVKTEEGLKILEAIDKSAGSSGGKMGAGGKAAPYVITLEVKGKKLSSEELAEKINALTIEGKSEIIFVIGGSLGLSKEVSDKADLKLSFSDMTFPHQLMRVILLEQIYRAFKINRGETYHK